MKKKIFALFLSALFLLMSGCGAMGLEPQTLLAPPKANEDQQEIHRLLQSDNQELSFVFPKNGEYRSAVTMYDFTGDGIEDAIGFYLLESGGAEVQFMTKKAEVWETIAKFKNSATQVDKICFGDLNGNGIDEVIIGWGNTQNMMSASLCTYVYHNDAITEIPLQSVYGAMTFTDFDGNGKKELFLMQRQTPEQTDGTAGAAAKALVYELKDEKYVELYHAEADSSIVRYPQVVFGKISEQQSGVFLDGARADSSMSTQIFYLDDEGYFKNSQLGVNTDMADTKFHRLSGASFLCSDVNDDEIIEIPVPTLLPALPEGTAPDSTSYMISWNTYGDKGFGKTVATMLANSAENYSFLVPGYLIGKITSSNNMGLRAVTYYLVGKSENGVQEALIESPLFTIRVFSLSAWGQRGELGDFEMLTTQNDTVYGISIQTADEKYIKLIDRIKENFILTSN